MDNALIRELDGLIDNETNWKTDWPIGPCIGNCLISKTSVRTLKVKC